LFSPLSFVSGRWLGGGSKDFDLVVVGVMGVKYLIIWGELECSCCGVEVVYFEA